MKVLSQNPILGVRYNVIRRSAHKSTDSMLKKVNEDIAAGRGGEWFARWKVEVTPADVARFRRETLDPVLEQLCDWWRWIISIKDPFDQNEVNLGRFHWRHPHGVWNPMDNGAESDVDSWLETGSLVGLQRTDNLFPELT